ncbi:MAG: toxin-antitoxin system HicB family antitoxin [Lacunisphaera sp.]
MKTRKSANPSAASKAAHYIKFVEWSEADQVYIGRCPGLFAGGVHGDDEARVYKEFCDAVADWIVNIENGGQPLPPPTAGKKCSGKFVVRVAPDLHQRAALKALLHGVSLNQLVERTLVEA